MVKKQCNKYQNSNRDWNETSTPNDAAPESPTEACVAPPYYTSLTNQTSKSIDFNE